MAKIKKDVFLVENPLIKIDREVKKHFYLFPYPDEYYPPKEIPLKCKITGPLTVKLIKCNSGYNEEVLKEIDKRGYILVPTPYLLGLGIKYPEIHKKYKNIVSLDVENIFLRRKVKYFLNLSWSNRNKSRKKWEINTLNWCGRWYKNKWWFAVTAK